MNRSENKVTAREGVGVQSYTNGVYVNISISSISVIKYRTYHFNI